MLMLSETIKLTMLNVVIANVGAPQRKPQDFILQLIPRLPVKQLKSYKKNLPLQKVIYSCFERVYFNIFENE
jgi:hypothetical protein